MQPTVHRSRYNRHYRHLFLASGHSAWEAAIVCSDLMIACSWQIRLLPLAVAAALAIGCTSGGGNRLPINTATHRLLASTEQLRWANSQPQSLPRELEKGVLPAYIVEPGDTLLIEPVELDSPVRFAADQVVLPDGQIELGRYGRLLVAGLTPAEIEREVQAIVERENKDAGRMRVSLVGRQSKVFYVLGEVNSPGAYPLSGRETVLDAIIAAGGPTDAADLAKITYTQPTLPGECRVVLPVCYREIVQMGDTSTNYQIAPGDRIYVPSMTLCRQLMELLHRYPTPECPPCGEPQQACPQAIPSHVPAATQHRAEPETLPAPQQMSAASKRRLG
jgi:protein involved in polysaccharide export with SLBB domain